MSTKRIAILSVAVLASLAVLVAAAPAGAVPPERVTETLDFTAPDVSFECPTGQLVLSGFTLNRTITTYFDQSGEPVRRVRHFTFEGALYSEDLSRSVPWTGHGHVVVDLVTGTLTRTGLEVAELPGPNAILAGRLVLSEEGETFTGRGFERFEAMGCEYLYAAD